MFLKNKDKEFFQLSETVEKPKLAETKPVTTGHQKIVSELSKPIKQSETINQLTNTEEKTNIVDIKSVTIEQPKTATKLSKPIKQPEIITQEPKAIKRCKIKDYREPKETDCHQKLEIARRHDNFQ